MPTPERNHQRSERRRRIRPSHRCCSCTRCRRGRRRQQAAQGIGRVDLTNETPADENYFVGRFDYTVTNTTNLFVRYTGDLASVFEPNSGSAIPLWNSDDKTSNHYVTAELRQLVTPTVANTLRFGATAHEKRLRARISTTGCWCSSPVA